MSEIFINAHSQQKEEALLVGSDPQVRVASRLIHAAYTRLKEVNTNWYSVTDGRHEASLIDRLVAINGFYQANRNYKNEYAMPVEDNHIAEAMSAYLLSFVGMSKFDADRQEQSNFQSALFAVSAALRPDEYGIRNVEEISKSTIERARATTLETRTINESKPETDSIRRIIGRLSDPSFGSGK